MSECVQRSAPEDPDAGETTPVADLHVFTRTKLRKIETDWGMAKGSGDDNTI